MEEINFMLVRKGNDFLVINKGYRHALGIVHICDNKYTLDDDDKHYSHLQVAVETLISRNYE